MILSVSCRPCLDASGNLPLGHASIYKLQGDSIILMTEDIVPRPCRPLVHTASHVGSLCGVGGVAGTWEAGPPHNGQSSTCSASVTYKYIADHDVVQYLRPLLQVPACRHGRRVRPVTCQAQQSSVR